jgi:hypothetical protein
MICIEPMNNHTTISNSENVNHLLWINERPFLKLLQNRLTLKKFREVYSIFTKDIINNLFQKVADLSTNWIKHALEIESVTASKKYDFPYFNI